MVPGTIAAVISVGMWQLGAWQGLERLAYQMLFQLRPDPGWDERIAVIAIDEKSLQEYGQFPWQRDRYAELLQALESSPPAAIGFDILFLDPSPQDEELAEAIAANDRAVLARGGEGEEPLPILQSATAAIGHIVHEPDSDGISRQAIIWFDGIPTLSLAMLHLAREQTYASLLDTIPPTAKIQPNPELDWINLWIDWPGKMEAVPTYPFVDVVEGNVPPDAFRDQLVLLGFVATGVDTKISPLQRISGVYLHAAILDNFLQQRFLQRLPQPVTILLLMAIALGMSWLQFKREFTGRLAIALLLSVGWFAIAFAAFTWAQWWLPVAAPIGSIILAGTGGQLRDQYEKQQLLNLFSKQISPQLAHNIWSRRDEIFQNGDLPPQELTATVLFMDIRGFTSISELMSPRDLLPWLNEYLDGMSDCILDNGGVIDKYIGDAIMAVFGVPFPRESHSQIEQDALNAIAACFAMHQRLQVLNQKFKQHGQPEIRIGIGMHTGSLIAGSVGGRRRANFSALGDTVNVAARLEPMNKQFTENNPLNLLVTSHTYEYVRDRYVGIQVGQMQLRGKQQETTIYAIVEERSTAD